MESTTQRLTLGEDWFAELRSDSDLQAQVLELVVELSSWEKSGQEALRHLERMGLLVAPIVANVAQVSGDSTLRKLAATLLFRWGEEEWGPLALSSPQGVHSMARWALAASTDERTTFLGNLSRLEDAPRDIVAYLRLSAGDASSALADVRSLFSERRAEQLPQDLSQRRRIVELVAKQPEGLAALAAMAMELGADAPSELVGPWVEEQARVDVAPLEKYIATPGFFLLLHKRGEGTVKPPALSSYLKAIPAMPVASQAALARATPPRFLSRYLAANGPRRRDGWGGAELWRAVAETATDPAVIHQALTNLVRTASRESGTLPILVETVEHLARATDSSRRLGPDTRILIKVATRETVDALASLRAHPSLALRRLAVASLGEAATSLREDTLRALFGFLEALEAPTAESWTFVRMPPEHAQLAARLRQEARGPVSESLRAYIYGAFLRWIERLDPPARREIVGSVVADFARQCRPVATYLADPWPEVRVRAGERSNLLQQLLKEALGERTKPPYGRGLWELASFPGGLTLLRLHGDLLTSLGAPGRRNWSEEAHQALDAVIARACNAKLPAMEREEILQFLFAFFAWVPDEAAQPYRRALLPAVRDDMLSPGFRWLALAIAAGTQWGGPNLVDPKRPRFPESELLIPLLGDPDPILDRYALRVAWTMTHVVRDEHQERLFRAFASSSRPLLRAWAVSIEAAVDAFATEQVWPTQLRSNVRDHFQSDFRSRVRGGVRGRGAVGVKENAWPLSVDVRREIARQLTDDPEPRVSRTAVLGLIGLEHRAALVAELERMDVRTGHEVQLAFECAQTLSRLAKEAQRAAEEASREKPGRETPEPSRERR